MLNPEQAFLNKTTVNEKRLSPSEKAIYEWYLKNPQQIKGRKERFNFEDMKRFVDIYGEEEVKKDIKNTLFWRNKDTARDMHQRAEMLEAIMTTQADMNEWYGDLSISKTSEYDDYENHTDSVLHGKTEDSEEVFIGVDWTVSQDAEVINNKVSRIANEIERGELTKIKYFESSEDENNRRELDNIPRVIIAMPDSKFQKLCEQTVQIINREEGANNNFSKSELQTFILEEIKAQLEKQLELAGLPGNNTKQKMTKVKESIKTALIKINEIIENKKNFLTEKGGQEV